MFNFKFKLLTILTFVCLVVISCSEENSNDTSNNAANRSFVSKSSMPYDSKILDDKDFQAYVQEEFYAMNRISAKDMEALEGVQITDQNSLQFVNALGYNSLGDYADYQKTQSSRLAAINLKFQLIQYPSTVQEGIFTDAVVYQKLIADPNGAAFMSCQWKKNFCDAGVIGLAITAQSACLAMDIATVGATAIAGCHFGAALAQAAGHGACIGWYDDCIKAQNGGK